VFVGALLLLAGIPGIPADSAWAFVGAFDFVAGAVFWALALRMLMARGC
jgi:hypothetical protein